MFRGLQEHNTRSVSKQIDKGDYAEEDLVLVKIPLTLPYAPNQDDYERYEGAIDWGGIHYNYVKRKLQNDTLYVLCLPNEQQTKLRKAGAHYAGHMNDLPARDKAETKLQKLARAEYLPQQAIALVETAVAHSPAMYPPQHSALLHPFTECLIQPPDHFRM